MFKIIAREEEINLMCPESQYMHRRLIETVQSGIYLTEARGKLTYVNHAFVEMLGYNIKDDVLGRNFVDELFAREPEKADFLHKMQEVGFVRELEAHYLQKDGTPMVLSVTGNNIYNDKGDIIGCEGVVSDVTEKKKLEEELVIEKRKLEQILDFDEKIVTIHEYDPLIDFIVERTAAILGARRCSLMLWDEETKELFIRGAKGLEEGIIKGCRVKPGEAVSGLVAQSRMPLLVKNVEYDERFKRAGKLYYLSRSFMSVPIVLEEKLTGVINVTDKGRAESFTEIDLRILGAIAREVAIALENVRLYKELNFLTVTDPLTLIYNYRQFFKSLNYEIKRRKRMAGHLSLIIMDIDDFKLYNDTFGHLEGDALLKDVGRILKTQLRETDIVCRYGGDEFAVILPDITLEGARIAAEKIRQAVENTSFKMKVTVSMGIADYESRLNQYEFILKADRALYKAKREGKNRVSCEAEQIQGQETPGP